METIIRDTRLALRSMRMRPGFTAIVVVTLALGMGATTAIFSVVRGVLLRPLPYHAAERIVQVWNPWSNEPGVSRGRSSISSLDYTDIAGAVTSFSGVAAYAPQNAVNLAGGETVARVQRTRATAALFDVLGARALIGRAFVRADDTPGGNDVVVLSHALWQQRFGGDAAIVGGTIRLDGEPHRIIGVMPPSFRMPADYLIGEPTDVWTPLGLDVASLDRGNQWLHVLARLRPDATLAAANAELAALTRHWIEQGFKIRDLAAYYAVPIEEELFGDTRPALLLLFGAVCFVLLIACANVANLLLARADGRRVEIAVRTALGAARTRIVAQLLAESVVLAAIAAALGLLLAYVGVQVLVALEPASLPRVAEVTIDPATLAFTAVVALGTAGIFGILPALQSSRHEPGSALRASGRTIAGDRRTRRLGSVLAAGEVLLSVVLVIGATLLIRTFAELSRVELGFRPERVTTFALSLPAATYADGDARIAFYTQVAQQLAGAAGVEAVGAARVLPLAGRLGGGSIEVEGRPAPAAGESPPNARWQIVTPGFFQAMGHTLAAGRLLDENDRSDAVPVVVINETMANLFWPGESTLGKRVRNTNTDVPWFTVAGVVRDVRHSGIVDTPAPTMYLPLAQMPLTRSFTPSTMTFAVKAAGSTATHAGAIRSAVRSVDPNIPVSSLRTMDDIVADALGAARFTMALLATFAGLALVLAVVGIYGLLSYRVTRQWHEIGIRVALGASRSAVIALVVRSGLRPAMLGIGAGLICALLLARFLESMLYGVRPIDPATFVLVPTVFALVALAATAVPAMRASGIDPVLALRQE